MTSSKHCGDPCDVIFGRKRKKIGILEILSRSVRHQNRKKPSIKNENLGGDGNRPPPIRSRCKN